VASIIPGLGAYLFIGVSVLTVGAAAAILLSQDGRALAASWISCCLSLSALALFHPGPPWLISALIAALALGLGITLKGLSTPDGFFKGPFRRGLAVISVWAISLLILRFSHRSPEMTVDSRLYWSLYTTAALFGLGLVTMILKRSAAHAWSGIGVLFLSPLPIALTSSTTLALFCVLLCAVHGCLAVFFLSRAGELDTQAWEELQG
jgi:hypothetical protein